MWLLLTGFMQCVLASLLSNSYCVTTYVDGKTFLNKQTKSNKQFLRNTKLGKRNPPISVAAFTASVGLQVLRNSSRYSTCQIPLLVRTTFCIKTDFNVPRSQVLRLEHPAGVWDPRHRCVPTPAYSSEAFGAGLEGSGGKELCFGLVSRQCCSGQLGGNHWPYSPRQKPIKKFALKLEMYPNPFPVKVWLYSPAFLHITHYMFYKAYLDVGMG